MVSLSPPLCDPPWPPDLCVVHRDSPPSDLTLRSSSFLHPEAPPCLDVGPSRLLSKSAPVDVPSISPSPALWVSKLKSSSHNLKKMASPTFSADGTPIVNAPDSVIFRPSQTWKGYLVAQFHGTPPSVTKILADLNPIWGNGCLMLGFGTLVLSSENTPHRSHSITRTDARITTPSPRAISVAEVPSGVLRKSLSLPTSPVGSVGSVNSRTIDTSPLWIRVGTKSPSEKAKRTASPAPKTQLLTSDQLDSEEEMICAAQRVIRNRLSGVGLDIPPFSNAADRKKFRKSQRQAFRSLCEDEGGTGSDSGSGSGSGSSVNKSQVPIAFGSIEAVLPKQASPFLEA
ncbi:hypothetical protein Bca4012_034831 [Brassica carinata]